MQTVALRVLLVALLAMAACSHDSPDTQWFYTCGDPVCHGYVAPASVPACTSSVRAGESCPVEGMQCDPKDDCNRLLICAGKDPRAQGGCPVSRAAFKKDVVYVDAAARDQYRRQLLGLRLATWRYREGAARRHLGFMIDDAPAMCVDPERDMVDLYGFTSMAVATIQAQQAQ